MKPATTDTSAEADGNRAGHFVAWYAHSAFVVLLAVSFIVPLIHWRFMDLALEYARRPFLLRPMEFALLRDLGHLTRLLPVGVGLQWILALRFRWLRSAPAIVALAVAISLAIGFYALFCAAVLAMHVSMRP